MKTLAYVLAAGVVFFAIGCGLITVYFANKVATVTGQKKTEAAREARWSKEVVLNDQTNKELTNEKEA